MKSINYQTCSPALLQAASESLEKCGDAVFSLSLELRAGGRDAGQYIETSAQVEIVNRALNAMAALADIIGGESASDVRDRLDAQLQDLEGYND